MMKKQAGFTLIELLIAVVIIGVISTIAIPAFQTFNERTYRAEACKGPILEIALLMEQSRDVNQTYPAPGTMSAAGIPYDDSSEKYNFLIDASTANTYTLRCQRIDPTWDNDCGDLTYDNFGRRGRTGAGRTVEECWR